MASDGESSGDDDAPQAARASHGGTAADDPPPETIAITPDMVEVDLTHCGLKHIEPFQDMPCLQAGDSAWRAGVGRTRLVDARLRSAARSGSASAGTA